MTSGNYFYSRAAPVFPVYSQGSPVYLLTMKITSKPLSKNVHLLRWVKKMAELCQPDAIHWVDGSQREYDALCAMMVKGGTFIPHVESFGVASEVVRFDWDTAVARTLPEELRARIAAARDSIAAGTLLPLATR